jgi:hypothetical protein
MEVDKKLVLNMIYTFLEDNGYGTSLLTLQKEAGLGYVIPLIKQGEWEAVLHTLSHIHVAPDLLYALYEQIIFELVEEGDSKIGNYFVFLISIGLVLLQQPGVQQLKQSHMNQIK